MTLLQLSVPLFVTILAFTSARCPRQAQVATLADLLSPSSTENALKLLSMAALGAKPVRLVEEAVPRCANPAVPGARYTEIVQPRRVLVERPQELYTTAVVTEMVYPGAPIPQPCSFQPRAVPEVYPAVPEYPTAPMAMVNPFLPAASPVSAMAPPTSTLLPPMDPTKVRSQFLRKIPIPPPCL